MFSCARVKDNIIIQVNFKRAMIGLASAIFSVLFLLWFGWIIIVKVEAVRLRQEIHQNVSGAIESAMQGSFNQNHSTLLKLEACQAQLMQSRAISSDLAKSMNKKIMDTKEEEEEEHVKKR